MEKKKKKKQNRKGLTLEKRKRNQFFQGKIKIYMKPLSISLVINGVPSTPKGSHDSNPKKIYAFNEEPIEG